MSSSLSGQVALVTGASAGIGAAVSKHLASLGLSVVLVARRQEALDGIVSEITKAGGKAIAVIGDVTKVDDMKSAVKTTIDTYGSLNVVVANAGVMLLSPVKAYALSEAEKMVDINFKGTINTVAAALPVMNGPNGHIIGISSDADSKVWRGSAVYSATKAAVSLYLNGLRHELASESGTETPRVTVIRNGATSSELSSHITDPEMKAIFAGAPPFKFLTGEDIAAAIEYAITAPAHVDVESIQVRPRGQDS